MTFKVGDTVVEKPAKPVVGEVVKVYADGQMVVKWPNGINQKVDAKDYQLMYHAETEETK